MWETIILGAIQGIVEWLPVSSEAVLILMSQNIFGGDSIVEMVQLALFFHFGTLLSVVVYFWKDILVLMKKVVAFKDQDGQDKALLYFYMGVTFVSVIVAGLIYFLIKELEGGFGSVASLVNVGIGVLLLVTAYLQFRRRRGGLRVVSGSRVSDVVLVGLGQGFAAFPGISRSGTTTAVLLLRGFKEEEALRASFLLSVPIVLIGNIVLNLNDGVITGVNLVGMLMAFVFGLLSIHGLLVVARKINFGWFVLVFGLLVIVMGLVA